MMPNAVDDKAKTPLGAFPTATLVIGVGTMGRRVLRLLGERWAWIAQDNPDDKTLHHLRMLQVDPDVDPSWGKIEQHEVTLAEKEGDSREPDYALDFLILRSLGLIRYHHGMWQIASPKDDGHIRVREDGFALGGDLEAARIADSDLPELSDDGWRSVVRCMEAYLDLPKEIANLCDQTEVEAAAFPPNGIFAKHSTFRIRRYVWIELAADPQIGARQLHHLLHIDGELARFIEPLLARVRDGNSPQVLLAALQRHRAWTQGYDPSPWGNREIGNRADGPLRRSYNLAIFENEHLRDATLPDEIPVAPPFFRMQGDDRSLTTPLHPWALLSLNWEMQGWTFQDTSSDRHIFRALPGSPRAFGFFDVDERIALDLSEEGPWYVHLCERMKGMAEDAHKGLIRLWGQLTHLRQEASDDSMIDDARTLRQSLELLGQNIIHDVIHETVIRREQSYDQVAPAADAIPPDPFPPWEDILKHRGTSINESFDERARELGLSFTTANDNVDQLVAELTLHLNDGEDQENGSNGNQFSDDTDRKLRSWLNFHMRRMLSIQQLSELPRPPGDKPLFIRIFVVGDLDECVTRISVEQILRIAHAETARVVTPIYALRFDGHTRPVTITPLLSMPHPADAAGAEDASGQFCAPEVERRVPRHVRERLIIDAVLRVRRWLELVPARERYTFEILVNGRTTDRSILTKDMAAEEIRAFIWMHARNSMSHEGILNRILNNQNADGLATFSCRELAFPAERARAWVVNRYARAMLVQFRDSTVDDVSHYHERLDGLKATAQFRYAVVKDVGKAALHIEHQWDDFILHAQEKIERHTVDTEIGDNTGTQFTRMDNASEILKDPRKIHFLDFDDVCKKAIEQKWSDIVRTHDLNGMGPISTGLRRKLLKRAKKTRNDAEQKIQKFVGELSMGDRNRHTMGSKDLYVALDGVSKAWDEAHKIAMNDQIEREQKVYAHRRIDPFDALWDAWGDFRNVIQKKPDYIPLWIGVVSVSIVLLIIVSPIVLSLLLRGMATDSTWFFSRLIQIAIAIPFILAFTALGRWWMSKHMTDIVNARDDFEKKFAQVIERDVVPFFESRLVYLGALQQNAAIRDIRVQQQEDLRLVNRIDKSARATIDILRSRVEDMGVRTVKQFGADGTGEGYMDDIADLFMDERPESTWLIPPSTLATWYHQRVSDGRVRYDSPVEMVSENNTRVGDSESPDKTQASLHAYFKSHPLHQEWRETAPFGHAAITEFVKMLREPPWLGLVNGDELRDRELFADSAMRAIINYTGRYFGSMGFGAQFRGYEAMDDDGIDGRALFLVMGAELYQRLEQNLNDAEVGYQVAARSKENAQFENCKHVVKRQVERHQFHGQPSSAYLLMTAYGIRERSFQNLRAFTSYHDRVQPPDAEYFPLSLQGASLIQISKNMPMQQLSHQRATAALPDNEGKP